MFDFAHKAVLTIRMLTYLFGYCIGIAVHNWRKEVNRMFYLGCDYHKYILAIRVENSKGKVVDEFKTSADQNGIDFIVERMKDVKWKIMGETSTYSINLHNYLVTQILDSILVDPMNIQMIIKSDKLCFLILYSDHLVALNILNTITNQPIMLATCSRPLARSVSPNLRLRSEKAASTLHLLEYPTSSFHFSLPTWRILFTCFARDQHPLFL